MTSTDKTIVAVDLFCGAGGLTHGFERAGIDVRVDVDPSCAHPFSANNVAAFLLADVASLYASMIARNFQGGRVTLSLAVALPALLDLLALGSPAGRRQAKGWGSRDDWTLVRRFGELVRALQPDLVTMENVPPLRDEPVFAGFPGCLDGYTVDHRNVDVRDVGLPQTQKRPVLVASKLGPIKLAAPDGAEGSTTVRQTIGKLRPIAAGEADPSDPLHVASRLSVTNLQRIRASKPGGTWRDWPNELRAKCHRRSTGATYPAVYGRMDWDLPSPTITTQCFGYGNGRFGHREQDRAITLREAAMLQGFPQEYSFVAGEDRPSFARIGRLIGNAVPVPLGEHVGRTLRDHVDAHFESEADVSVA